MSFPADRFVRAGADSATRAALGEEYDALPAAAQQTFSEQIATMSDQGVRDLLEQREERESAPTPASVTTPDPAPAPSAAGSSGTSTPDSSSSTSK